MFRYFDTVYVYANQFLLKGGFVEILLVSFRNYYNKLEVSA
jgi:hypothetical protein